MSSAPKPPTPVDPTTVINAETAANRVNRITPFGSQTYGPNGLTTTLPQGTMNAFNNISNMAGNQQQMIQAPQTSQLQDAILSKIGSRYGQGGGQPQKAGPQQLTAQGMNGNVMPTQGAWNQMFNMIGQNGAPPMTQAPMGSPAMPNPGFSLPNQGPQ